jgi:hypothetical protein
VEERQIEIVMQPAYRKFNYFYIPVKYTNFFPPGNPKTTRPVIIETGKTTLKAQLQYNSKAHV